MFDVIFGRWNVQNFSFFFTFFREVGEREWETYFSLLIPTQKKPSSLIRILRGKSFEKYVLVVSGNFFSILFLFHGRFFVKLFHLVRRMHLNWAKSCPKPRRKQKLIKNGEYLLLKISYGS